MMMMAATTNNCRLLSLLPLLLLLLMATTTVVQAWTTTPSMTTRNKKQRSSCSTPGSSSSSVASSKQPYYFSIRSSDMTAATTTTGEDKDEWNQDDHYQKKKSPQQQQAASMSSSSSFHLDSLLSLLDNRLEHLPKLIVFDLDNTLWTPELYQIRQPHVPVIDKDIRLFEQVVSILEFCKAANISLGIASRTNKVIWAKQLLQDFQLTPTYFMNSHNSIQIYPGSKTTHFAKLKQATGYSYADMMFLDDDVHMNLQEISSQLGVLCVHTPNGVTAEHVYKSLLVYNERKKQGQEWMGDSIILTHKTLNIQQQQQTGMDYMNKRICQGTVKFYSTVKKFGFVVDDETKDEFFVHESKVPAGMQLETGSVVTFEAILSASSSDGGDGGGRGGGVNNKGRASAIILTVSKGGGGTSGNDVALQNAHGSHTSTTTITFPGTRSMQCFTMSQPFCALLLNGVKTVESRNNPMFMDIQPGTELLVHCGQKDWHDKESYKLILANELSTEVMEQQSALPPKFAKGSIVGIVTVGRTWKSSDAERNSDVLQRKVLAPYNGIGKFCTEIVSYRWLQKPVKARGQPGVYTAAIAEDSLR